MSATPQTADEPLVTQADDPRLVVAALEACRAEYDRLRKILDDPAATLEQLATVVKGADHIKRFCAVCELRALRMIGFLAPEAQAERERTRGEQLDLFAATRERP